MLTLDQIRNVEFNRGRGYRTEDVDVFIDECVETVAQLQQENQAITQKMKALADQVAQYRNDEDAIRAALLNAQRTGDAVIREAKEKANAILQEAQTTADVTRRELLAEAAAEQEQLDEIKKEVAAFKTRLLDLYREHLSVIKLIPEQPEPEPEPTPEEAVEDVDDGTVVVAPISEEPTQAEEEETLKPFSRFDGLKFGNEYDMHADEEYDEDEEDESKGLFRKKK